MHTNKKIMNMMKMLRTMIMHILEKTKEMKPVNVINNEKYNGHGQREEH